MYKHMNGKQLAEGTCVGSQDIMPWPADEEMMFYSLRAALLKDPYSTTELRSCKVELYVQTEVQNYLELGTRFDPFSARASSTSMYTCP